MFSDPGTSSSSAVSRDERGEGGFRTFPQVQKSATLPPRSGLALPPHSSPWTPAAYDVPMAFEEELDYDVEYVEFDGSWWGMRGPGSPGVLLVVGRGRRVPDWPYCLAAPVAHRAWTRVTWSRLGTSSWLCVVDFVRVGVLHVAALGAAWVRVHGLVDCVRDGVLLFCLLAVTSL